MKVLYITAKTPWGRGEAFIIEEMLSLKKAGVNLLIIPRNPSKEIFHREAKELLENSIWWSLIDIKIVACFFKTLLISITTWKVLRNIIRYSRNPLIFTKNLAVLPKGVFVAGLIKGKNVEHIHAHWGSTTATMAYTASRITGIPWSFTLHRWDIKENNMLKEKVKSAKFARCISEHGKKELLEILGGEYKRKVKVIHMGVRVPANIKKFSEVKRIFTMIVPASLLEVKGHEYLIEACSILIKQGIKNFECIFYGEGPLRSRLKNLIKEKRLIDYIKMPGVIPHGKLIEMYRNKEVNVVILPSIITNKGEHEGIPVSLMEAMAHGIPVISTNTGWIPELLWNAAGIIAEERKPKEIAKAVEYLVEHPEESRKMGENGRKTVLEKYNWENESKKLLKIYEKLSKG